MSILDSPTEAMPAVPPAEDRQPRRRGRKIAIIVAVLVGVPTLAWAAIYLWGSVTGSTTFIDGAGAAVQATAVTGNVGPEGVSCASSSLGDAKTVVLAPKAPRANINGVQQVTPGTCTVDVTVLNNGAPVKVSAAATMPTGWTFSTPGPVMVTGGGGEAHIIATITATDTATAGPITGSLSLDTSTA